MNRSPDYEERSEKIAKECENDIALKAARKLIYEHLINSTKGLIDLTDNEDAALRLQAIKHHLKIGGLEVERSEASHKVEFEPFKISRGD